VSDAAVDPAVHRIAIPTPFMVGRVNCWLVEDEPLTLVDCGPNSGRALDELEVGLAALGHRVEDLQRIVLTHQHVDHIGLAAVLARRSGAEVCALAALAPVLEDHAAAAEADDELAERIMRRHGVDGDLVTALRAVARAYRGWGGSVHVDRRLADGETLAFANRAWTVQHRPGHSPSDTLFWDAERGMLIAGDHLIGHISSNPLLQRSLTGDADGKDRPHALLAYLASLRATRELPARIVLPGHGDPVTGHAALIDDRFELHAKRARRILRLIRERPRTAHEIARELWGDVAISQAFLTLSEVLGHADLLLERGAVVERLERDVARFYPA
jgi:glyoxylase-like metal-dependent hydrolase (beta-lactamase superfamily II)